MAAAVEQNDVVNCEEKSDESESESESNSSKTKSCNDSKSSEFQNNINKLADILSKLNPWAKEFIPSYLTNNNHNNFVPPNKISPFHNFPINNNNPRRRNNFNQGRRRMNGRSFRAQREESVRCTIYVSDIDQHVTEERLAALFISCGHVSHNFWIARVPVEVVDCRICGDPHSVLRFAFVEFADEPALNLGGTMLGYYPVRVLPSKTAILPVNPTFLPRSEDEREMCARTVYCTNIDKKVSQLDVKNFFESACGEAESAIMALNCSGMILGTQPIR